jgi:hypothetical protein
VDKVDLALALGVGESSDLVVDVDLELAVGGILGDLHR